MARTDSTKTLWRVQVRLGRDYKWRNYSGLHERREDAREQAAWLRQLHRVDREFHPGYGFGNTRVVKHIRGEKK